MGKPEAIILKKRMPTTNNVKLILNQTIITKILTNKILMPHKTATTNQTAITNQTHNNKNQILTNQYTTITNKIIEQTQMLHQTTITNKTQILFIQEITLTNKLTINKETIPNIIPTINPKEILRPTITINKNQIITKNNQIITDNKAIMEVKIIHQKTHIRQQCKLNFRNEKKKLSLLKTHT